MDDPIITAFNDAGVRYREAGVPFLADAAALVLNRLALERGADFVDVASGPGTIALAAARRVGGRGSVIGVDLSERQLEIARREAPQGRTVRFQHQDAGALDLSERSADAIACGLGLPYFEEPVRALREAARTARPRAPLVWSTFGQPFFGRPGERFLQALTRHEIAPPLLHLTHAPEDLAQLAFRAGLQNVEIEEHDLDVGFPSFDSFWEMARDFALLLTVDAAEPDARSALIEQLRTDPAVVDGDGSVNCRLRLLLLCGRA